MMVGWVGFDTIYNDKIPNKKVSPVQCNLGQK